LGLLLVVTALVLTTASACVSADEARQPIKPGSFPVTMQFSPVPSGKGWRGEPGTLSDQVIRDTIDNMIEHGATGLYCPVWVYPPYSISPQEAKKVIEYAESRGMFITYQTGGLEMFHRHPSKSRNVYAPEYASAVKKNIESRLAPLKDYTRVYNVFCYMDEPFNQTREAFSYEDEVKAEFRKRYGYDLPADLDSSWNDPKVWLDVINFRSDYFPDGWRQVYKILKQNNPDFKVIMTHDSHNTFGGAVNSDGEIGVDDVFHWGGDFADTFVFDVYPYMMTDFRYGEPSKLRKPRMSQLHYAFGQMRNLARTYGKELGFWFGTYNAAWFKNFMSSKLKAKYWAERETSTTAVAQGSNFILSGYEIPEDARHWEELGKGLRLIHKAGPGLLQAPKVKAKACFLFPRTQYIQLQEEYWNVALSFELFLRSFGELDVLHEEQIKDSSLHGYQILCLFDIKLLPNECAGRISDFVRRGGVVIADCVPQMDAYRQPTEAMGKLFGVQDAATGRINRNGVWRPKAVTPPGGDIPRTTGSDETPTKETLKGRALGHTFDLTIVSPRPCKVTAGEVFLKTASGQPALVHRKVGKGHVFLLGFCVQDTYFQTYRDEDVDSREQLYALLAAITNYAGVRSHVHSSNPDIEASLRANSKEGYLFVIDHESSRATTTVTLRDLPFEVKRIVDLENGKAVAFRTVEDAMQLRLDVPMGGTMILRLVPRC